MKKFTIKTVYTNPKTGDEGTSTYGTYESRDKARLALDIFRDSDVFASELLGIKVHSMIEEISDEG